METAVQAHLSKTRESIGDVVIAGRRLTPSPVFDTYWKFAAARQAVYFARLRSEEGLATEDPILAEHRFTNCFRASDRVSQFCIHDVAYLDVVFPEGVLAHLHLSWLDPCKVRRVTIVGSKKMVVCNDIADSEKIRIYDTRVDRPPHHDTFADFHYSYHYGDSYIPYIKQEEPLKAECQHFLDCIQQEETPLTNGHKGLELVRILEAASSSLRANGAPVFLSTPRLAPVALAAVSFSQPLTARAARP